VLLEDGNTEASALFIFGLGQIVNLKVKSRCLVRPLSVCGFAMAKIEVVRAQRFLCAKQPGLVTRVFSSKGYSLQRTTC